jgi:hypothetical protein
LKEAVAKMKQEASKAASRVESLSKIIVSERQTLQTRMEKVRERKGIGCMVGESGTGLGRGHLVLAVVGKVRALTVFQLQPVSHPASPGVSPRVAPWVATGFRVDGLSPFFQVREALKKVDSARKLKTETHQLKISMGSDKAL